MGYWGYVWALSDKLSRIHYSKTPAFGTRLYENGTLFLQIARTAGPDTYGGFITLVQVLYPNGMRLNLPNEFSLHPVTTTPFALGQNATVILQIPHQIKRVYDVDGSYQAYLW
ncbi:MAG: TQO small subunit DoxA domain-containing protein [Sulfolobaceae archaeon]